LPRFIMKLQPGGAVTLYGGVLALVLVALFPLLACAQSTGNIRFSNGETYQGEVRDSKPHGRGILRGVDGQSYEGEFSQGRPHGKGIWKYADGSVYDGQWASGQPHGRGKQVWKNGASYEGDWVRGQQSGRGKFTFPDGSIYDGDWLAGQQTGQGKTVWKDGSSYDGAWSGGKQNGQGTGRWPDGTTKSGTWADGKLVGKGVEVLAQGERLEVEYVDNKPNGKGILTWPDGAKYEGDFKDGDRTGHGVWTNKEGDRYEGEWLNGKRHGKGLQTLNGRTTTATWKEDSLVSDAGAVATVQTTPLVAARPSDERKSKIEVPTNPKSTNPPLDFSALHAEHFAFVKSSHLVAVRTPEQLLKDCPVCVKYKAELCFKGTTPIILHQPEKSGCRPWLVTDPDVARVRQNAIRASQTERDTGKSLFAEGFDLLGQSKSDAAIAAFEKGIASEPGDMRARYTYANLLMRAGRLVEAIEQYAIVANLADLRSIEGANSVARLKALFP
jgi:hypothetical protein